MKPTFYEIVNELVKNTPNNLELGDSIRKLVWKIEDSKKPQEVDPMQIDIFQDIERYGH